MIEKNELSRRQRRDMNETSRDMAAVLGTDEGRRLLRWMLDRCGVFLSSHSNEFENGRREMGLELIRVMDTVSPHSFVRLMQDGANAKVEHLNAQRQKGQNDDAD